MSKTSKSVRISVPICFYKALKQTVEKEERWPSIDAMPEKQEKQLLGLFRENTYKNHQIKILKWCEV